MVEEITADELHQRCQHQLQIKTVQTAEAAKIIKKMYPSATVTVGVNEVTVVLSGEADSALVNQALVQGGILVQSITFVADSMEDYFIQRMGGKA